MVTVTFLFPYTHTNTFIHIHIQIYRIHMRDVDTHSCTSISYISYMKRDNRELKRANDILKSASAFFAQAELDRRLK